MLLTQHALASKYGASSGSVSEALIRIKPRGKIGGRNRPSALYDEYEAATALIELYMKRSAKHAAQAAAWRAMADAAADMRGLAADAEEPESACADKVSL